MGAGGIIWRTSDTWIRKETGRLVVGLRSLHKKIWTWWAQASLSRTTLVGTIVISCIVAGTNLMWRPAHVWTSPVCISVLRWTTWGENVVAPRRTNRPLLTLLGFSGENRLILARWPLRSIVYLMWEHVAWPGWLLLMLALIFILPKDASCESCGSTFLLFIFLFCRLRWWRWR